MARTARRAAASCCPGIPARRTSFPSGRRLGCGKSAMRGSRERASRLLRLAPVVLGNCARRQALGREELEALRARHSREQSGTVAGHDGMNEEAIFVDQVEGLERAGELVSAEKNAARRPFF